MHNETSIRMFHEMLLVTIPTKRWKQVFNRPKDDKMWHINVMEYYTTDKGNKLNLLIGTEKS